MVRLASISALFSGSQRNGRPRIAMLALLSLGSLAAADHGDFNGDGHPDLVYFNPGALYVTVN